MAMDRRAVKRFRCVEAVSKIEGVALHPEIGGDKAPCAGNGGSISKYGNAVSADFWV